MVCAALFPPFHPARSGTTSSRTARRFTEPFERPDSQQNRIRFSFHTFIRGVNGQVCASFRNAMLSSRPCSKALFRRQRTTAFRLAFTFSIAAEGHDPKKRFTRDDAIAIRVFYRKRIRRYALLFVPQRGNLIRRLYCLQFGICLREAHAPC